MLPFVSLHTQMQLNLLLEKLRSTVSNMLDRRLEDSSVQLPMEVKSTNTKKICNKSPCLKFTMCLNVLLLFCDYMFIESCCANGYFFCD